MAAKTFYTDASTYAGATDVGLLTVEPSLTYNVAATASTGPSNISVAPNGTVNWAAAALSASGTCYTIKDVAATGTVYGSTTAANCTGTWAGTGANTNLAAFP